VKIKNKQIDLEAEYRKVLNSILELWKNEINPMRRKNNKKCV
jgi:hypothetical protein